MSSALQVGAQRALIGLLLVAFFGVDGGAAARAGTADRCRRSAQGPDGTLRDGATWQPLPAGPVDGRTFASVVWTGREVVVWGGEAGSELARKADGAAFDLSRGTWRELAASPITPRSEHAAVWTGREMIIWGGQGVPSESVPDAAAYDPKRDRWRRDPQCADRAHGIPRRGVDREGDDRLGWEPQRGWGGRGGWRRVRPRAQPVAAHPRGSVNQARERSRGLDRLRDRGLGRSLDRATRLPRRRRHVRPGEEALAAAPARSPGDGTGSQPGPRRWTPTRDYGPRVHPSERHLDRRRVPRMGQSPCLPRRRATGNAPRRV